MLRVLVANLYDFDPATDAVPRGRMLEIDRWAMARYAAVTTRIVQAYDDYDYPTVYQAANAFVTVDLSSFYVDVTKDRMYTFGARSEARRSGQTAMYLIADGLARLLAPILPFTMDELWRTLPGRREASVHLAVFSPDLAQWKDDELLERWTQAERRSRSGKRGARVEAAGQDHQVEPVRARAGADAGRSGAVSERIS